MALLQPFLCKQNVALCVAQLLAISPNNLRTQINEYKGLMPWLIYKLQLTAADTPDAWQNYDQTRLSIRLKEKYRSLIDFSLDEWCSYLKAHKKDLNNFNELAKQYYLHSSHTELQTILFLKLLIEKKVIREQFIQVPRRLAALEIARTVFNKSIRLLGSATHKKEATQVFDHFLRRVLPATIQTTYTRNPKTHRHPYMGALQLRTPHRQNQNGPYFGLILAYGVSYLEGFEVRVCE